MSEPKRIQRKRTKGSKMPADAVYVGRPTKWGNPWLVGTDLLIFENGQTRRVKLTAASAVQEYERSIGDWYTDNDELVVDVARRELAGKDLACWCPLSAPCHADVLLRLAREVSS